jgi:predicted N-acetyltransferase YhbS
MNIAIRKAHISDAGTIAGLLGELGYPTSPEEAEDRLRAAKRSASDVVLVAVDGEKVVGFVSLHVMLYFTMGHRVCRVLAIAVTEKARGQGIGRQLMDVAEMQARSMDCKAVEVTSADHREGAHAFYTRLGYPKTSAKFLKFLDD